MRRIPIAAPAARRRHVSESTSDLVSFARKRTIRDTHNQHSSPFRARAITSYRVPYVLSLSVAQHHRPGPLQELLNELPLFIVVRRSVRAASSFVLAADAVGR